jgi:hypothetical protein
MRMAMNHLRDGWYGNTEYHQWLKDGKPKTLDGKVGGTEVTVEQRRSQARSRFGRGHGEDDWIPSVCCRPVNCAGLVNKAIGEANAMIEGIEGISGKVDSVEGLTVASGATLVEPHTRDMNDLIGLPQEICDLTGLTQNVTGNELVLAEGAGPDGAAVAGGTVAGSDGLPTAAIEGDDEPDRRGRRSGAGRRLTCHCCGAAMDASESNFLACQRCG